MNGDVEHAYGWSSHRESEGNRLRVVAPYRIAVSPLEADIWFQVFVQRATSGTEVGGRIVGPRSLFAQRASVVSPLRSVWLKQAEQPALMARTAFPNPKFWDPMDPALYRVVVELWQDGQRCEVAGFDLGFRMLDMDSRSVLVNKRPLLLRGMAYLPESRHEAEERRRGGYNLVVAGKGQWNWWIRANPMGFLLLERVALSTLTPHHVALAYQQPCFLGFVLDEELLARPRSENESFLCASREQGVLIGLEINRLPRSPLPSGLSFLVCPESLLPALSKTVLPKILIRGTTEIETSPAPAEGILGWIDQQS